MPRYQVDIQTPEMKQTFVTEDLDTDEARRTRLEGFIDALSTLMDYTVDIRPLDTGVSTTPIEQVKCMHDPERICPLGEEQSGDTCLHCEGRGL